MTKTTLNKFNLQRIFSWFGSPIELFRIEDSLLNSAPILDIGLPKSDIEIPKLKYLDFEKHNIWTKIDLIEYLNNEDKGDLLCVEEGLPTEVSYLEYNIHHDVNISDTTFNELFNYTLDYLFGNDSDLSKLLYQNNINNIYDILPKKADDVENEFDILFRKELFDDYIIQQYPLALQLFISSGKSFKFQLCFTYSELNLQNTWISSLNLEYIKNQVSKNNVLSNVFKWGPDNICLPIETGKNCDFPIVSPVFECIPNNLFLNWGQRVNNDSIFSFRELYKNHLSEIDKDLLTPYSNFLPNFGSNDKVSLQILNIPSNVNWAQRVDLHYLINVAKIERVSIVIWS